MECFTVYADEIEGRIDPHFYRPEFRELKENLSKLESKPLGEIIEFSSETWNQKDSFDNEFPYIEISEIDISTGEIQNITYYEKKNAPSRAKMRVRENDIIVSTTRPHRGAIAHIDREKDGFIASTGFAILRDLKIEVNKEYLLFMLRTQLSLKQMLQRSSGGNYPAITSGELKNILIPIPPKKTQEKIVSLMKEAYYSKESRESEAEQLLDSVNDYILDELGLKIDEEGKKVFAIESNKITGRLDPLYYSIDIYYFLRKGKYPGSPMGETVKDMKTGFAAGKNEQDLEEEGIIQIRPTNISNKERRLIFTKNVYIKEEQKDKLRDNLLKKSEVLFNNTNSQEMVGKTTLFSLEGDFFCSNHITRLTVNPSKLNPMYLASLLNLYQAKKIFFRICTNWNNQSGVNNELLKTVEIPLPPLSVQNKIADEVKKRMQKAEQLQKEAKEELQKAKEEVEEIILGS